ncbi:SPFH domain-containing protein [Metasolibacillus sp. FSL H7-0170]|uniref:SPFH domain-containing protein n=1 Tax=Metasolibacillus TaxID=2703677 RepID=UPI0007925662|nr:SPFH domain-containing protein [Metasolibacillus fluoroglycofenilyticus]KYG90907.1 virion core protein (lumpy skin disease virus) [[Bacillus] sp. KCTC 13219]
MALFDRIKFDGLRSRDWVIYKYPTENIKLGSTLIVNEGQVALFVKGGQVCDAFPSGSYVLSTNNLPIIGSIVNFAYGGKTPFTAEIYYINLASKLDLYWGTSNPIQLIDPKYFVKLRIRAFGQMALRIDNYMLFFSELIGSMTSDEIVQYEKVQEYFRGLLITHIKTELANKIIREKISALEISTELANLSQSMEEIVKEKFEGYGFSLLSFHIKSINFPDEDFEEINKILTARAKFEIMGDDRYTTQRSFDVYEGAANNQNNVTSSVLLSNFGLNTASEIITSMQQQLPPLKSIDKHSVCPSCNEKVKPNSKFCNSCGANMEKKVFACPSCNFENNENANFCGNCGKSFKKSTCSCGTILDFDARFCHNCGEKAN